MSFLSLIHDKRGSSQLCYRDVVIINVCVYDHFDGNLMKYDRHHENKSV